MYVGVCKVKMRLPDNHSLKGKRQVLKSVIARAQNEFNVAIAEVDSQDLWQIAELGFCCVSNDANHAMEMVAKVVSFIERSRPDMEMLDYETEVMQAF
jgi:uncharacterized protein YlxP (DUF503 family)